MEHSGLPDRLIEEEAGLGTRRGEDVVGPRTTWGPGSGRQRAPGSAYLSSGRVYPTWLLSTSIRPPYSVGYPLLAQTTHRHAWRGSCAGQHSLLFYWLFHT